MNIAKFGSTPPNSLRLTGIFLLATMVLIPGYVSASDLSKMKAAGGKRLSQGEIASMYIGKTVRAESPDGKLKWTTSYKTDGTKVTKISGKTIIRDWSYKNGKWCETLNRNSARICSPIVYKLAGTCHGFTPDGKEVAKWRC